jgi:hypothetical protein
MLATRIFLQLFHFLSFNVFISTTVVSLVISTISAGITLFYSSINFTIEQTAASFIYVIAFIVSIVISVEAQTKLNAIITCRAQIDSAERTIARICRRANVNCQTFDTVLTLPNADVGTLSGPYMQRETAICTIQRFHASTSMVFLRIACTALLLIYLVFLQPLYTTSTDYARIMTNHFCVGWPSILVVMLIHYIARECTDLSHPYTIQPQKI